MPKTPNTAKPVARFRLPAWWVVLVLALVFVTWSTARRIGHVERVSGLASEDASIPGARGPRNLIVPERNENSMEWIRQTAQMLDQGTLRVRRVDFDNAPMGRDVISASPYRWWLAAMAGLDHLLSGHRGNAAVEYGALLADPLLLAIALGVLGGFAHRRFGTMAACVVTGGLAFLFPLAACFAPGVPDIRGLTAILTLAALLVPAAALDPSRSLPSQRRNLVAAGVIGGLVLWINVPVGIAIVVGLGLGAAAGAWTVRAGGVAPKADLSPISWRWWSVSGGATVLVAYFLEFAPANLGGWRLDAIHPVYGVAWIGLGELVARLDEGWSFNRRPKGMAGVGACLGALVAVALPFVIGSLAGQPRWTARDVLWARLDSLSDGITATNTFTWIAGDGFTARVCATLLPLLVFVPAAVSVIRRTRDIRVALMLGPVLIATALAFRQLSWWSYADAGALALGIVLVASLGKSVGSILRGTALATLTLGGVAGLVVLWPGAAVDPAAKLAPSESEELVERHVARWLAFRSGETAPVVFAPPHFTMTLGYYGGLRGIGTFAPENQAGFGTSLAIAGVTTMEEVQELLRSRGVRYLILPSWDPFFDNFASLYLAGKYSHRSSFLAAELRHWNLPLWLRPVPYQLPVAGDFTGQSIALFEVVDEQTPVAAASRLTEYFVETGDVDQAQATADNLRQFPGDIGALTAIAQVQLAREDRDGLARTLESLQARLEAGGDRYLPWDRRISLATVLARAGRVEAAQVQLRRTVSEANEARVRSLTTGTLFGWQVLMKAFHQEIADAHLRMLAADLLPGALREKL